MEKYLPSKKFVLILLAIIVVGGILAYGSNKIFGKKEVATYSKDLAVGTSSGSPDRDKDGLPDWEEVLWGTDPNNPTTHAETPDVLWVRDKEREIIDERNAKNETLSAEEGEPNATDLFLQEFLLSYTKLKTSGTITEDATAYISDTFVDSFIDQTETPDTFTTKDAKMIDVHQNTVTTYKNTVIALGKKHSANKTVGTELELFAELLETDKRDKDIETKLVQIGNAYTAFGKELMTISVPKDMISAHIILANTAIRAGRAVTRMADMNKDPLMGLLGLSEYDIAGPLLESAIETLLVS